MQRFLSARDSFTGRSYRNSIWFTMVKSMILKYPSADRASVENAVTVAAVCLSLGIAADIISSGLKGLVSVAMRMEMKSGINNCQLIEDYYNSDPGSLGMALEYLRSQTGRKPTLILSDFVQSGRDEKGTVWWGGIAGKENRN